MIQKCYSLFKSFFENNENKYDVDTFQIFEIYLLNHPERLNYHVHKDGSCNYPKFKYYRTYDRNFIYRCNNKNIDGKVNISVCYCENDSHFHAIIPYNFIIPYLQYSLAFVISVLDDRLSHHLTIDEIENKYQISKNTFYRWLEAYNNYYRIFITMRNKKDMDFFVSYLSNPIDFIDSIYEITQATLFQSNRKLFRQNE